MRFTPEEKLEIIQLARYTGLGFKKTLRLFGLKPQRVWQWIRRIERYGLRAGLTDNPPRPRTISSKRTDKEEALILNKANEYTRLNHRNLSHQIFRDSGLFLSETLVYRVLKKHNLIIPRPVKIEAGDKWRSQPEGSNEIWHIDISYIPCGAHSSGRRIFYYLVAVLDGFSRFVLAWELFPDMVKERCFEVVDSAMLLAQLPEGKRPKLLSDNGSQFRARKAREFFKELFDIQQIFTGTHHPETNGKIERLFKSAKYEALYRSDYSSPQEAREILLDFFDYYNNRRPHQALGYRTPQEAYYGLNQDYSQRRQRAKDQAAEQRRQYWGPRDLLTIQQG